MHEIWVLWPVVQVRGVMMGMTATFGMLVVLGNAVDSCSLVCAGHF